MMVVIAFIHLVNTKQQYHNSLKLKSIIINLKNPKFVSCEEFGFDYYSMRHCD